MAGVQSEAKGVSEAQRADDKPAARIFLTYEGLPRWRIQPLPPEAPVHKFDQRMPADCNIHATTVSVAGRAKGSWTKCCKTGPNGMQQLTRLRYVWTAVVPSKQSTSACFLCSLQMMVISRVAATSMRLLPLLLKTSQSLWTSQSLRKYKQRWLPTSTCSMKQYVPYAVQGHCHVLASLFAHAAS